MSIPTYDKFIEPILRHLAAAPGDLMARDVHTAAADSLRLSPEARLLVYNSGQPVYKNRAGWAHDRLKRAGLSASPRRGYWQLTPEGRNFAKAHPSPLDAGLVEELARGYDHVLLRSPDRQTGEPEVLTVEPTHLSPEEQIEAALLQIRETVAVDVLERLLQVSPTYFETVVLDLLHRMGYGASRKDLQRVGGSGDAGIDGVISLDKLGLEKVYVQAKRWKDTVSRPEIQAFYGALAGQRANKGVFLTTSSFTSQAVDFARSVERIVLVDGQRLAQLMIEHEVGVSLKPLFRPELDGDYFDE